MHTSSKSTPIKVLVIGGGFSGSMAAARLASTARDRVEVTVVNPRGEFVNRIRLHQAALGHRLPRRELRRLLGSRVVLIEGRVAALDVDAGRAEVSTQDGIRALPFDRVILATGSVTATPPIPGAEHVHGIGDVASARRLRPVLAALPRGSAVAVVGAGFTGLETAAEIAETRTDLRVRLITSGAVGSWFTDRARDYVQATLRRLGVDAVGGARAVAAEPGRLLLDDGAEVPSDLTVWCGGFTAPPLAREAGLSVDAQGAVLTDSQLRSLSHPAVLAVGDSAHAPGPGGGRFSMSCQFAFPSGAHAADVVRGEELDGDPALARGLDLGFVGRTVSLGRRAAVVQLTGKDDAPADRAAITGHAAVVAKRVQFAGMAAAVSAGRSVPGLIRWPRAERTAATSPATVAV